MILFKNDFINNKYLILKKQIQIILTFRSWESIGLIQL